MKQRSIWSREELIVVLDLYFHLPQGRFTDSDPDVIEIARLIGRTPGSVAMRLANYLSLDERSGAQGLAHGGEHAKRIWDEFQGKAAEVSFAASEARRKLLQR